MRSIICGLLLATATWVVAQPSSFSSRNISVHNYNGVYADEYTDRVAFPIGGLGAGMFCLEGTGAISHLSIRHRPEMFNEPPAFAAISIQGVPNSARVLEGPVPDWKKFGEYNAALGMPGATWGLRRFEQTQFTARFPFGKIELADKELPVAVQITGWSPFIPSDADNSSLPVGALEYHFTNSSSKSQHYVFSYNTRNFIAYRNAPNHIKSLDQGFILSQEGTTENPEWQADFAIFTDDPATVVNHCWFRGGWFDPMTMVWNDIENGIVKAVEPQDDAIGASLMVPFTLKPGEKKTIRLMMAWYVPNSKLRMGKDAANARDSTVRNSSVDLPSPYHKPWYSSKFANIKDVVNYWREQYETLQKRSELFKEAFYSSTLPPEVIEAVAANLTILKSPTVLRQYDGRLWSWEGCEDMQGSCPGNCEHVWNYAQALSHLFPELERGLRRTEYFEDQNAEGHQEFRAILPIRPQAHLFHAASDGQLGGIMKVYRDWRISGDSNWLRALYPRAKLSMDYCIRTWDPRHKGVLEEPHHNTYDIEFWGAEPMCTGFYLGALEAMIRIGSYLGEDVSQYSALLASGKQYLDQNLFNGEYFYQHIQWKGLNATDPVEASKHSLEGNYSPEAIQLLEKEGPKYQYGTGCLSDGMLGAWMARVCGLDQPVDSAKALQHLLSVYKYNLQKDLIGHSNPQRPTFALGHEGGLLLCSWPKGGKLSLPFIYSDEVWTGIEYEVASHLIFMGKVREGLDIVRTCRSRYDGRVRNPFDEYECGHWYARAMSSYALLESLTGVRYDAVERTLYIKSRVGDFTSFLATATGFGTVKYSKGKASVQVVYGKIDVARTVILP